MVPVPVVSPVVAVDPAPAAEVVPGVAGVADPTPVGATLRAPASEG